MQDTAAPKLPPGAPTPRDKVLEDYRTQIKVWGRAVSVLHASALTGGGVGQEARAYKKKQHKQVILEDVRKRPPRLHLRQETIRPQKARDHPNGPQSRKKEIKESPTKMVQGGNYLKKFLGGQFRLGADKRPEDWAAAKINRAMRNFMELNHLLDRVLEMRKAKRLVSESDAEMRALVANVGVSFARFSDSLDKLHEEDITLQDLLQICGHPLIISKDAAGNTPLHYAAEGGHLTLCELLLANGANINAQNKSGETPYV
ncbi:unnamed protein product [Phytophthora fragariaefolia]|uniref:Unnamed protein product n=1 Tax=Phytophthora fragariaefolia TaxID=1490495 RepID=A0A9W6X2E0_9STRA|nr:unnamed protein product [Phytophthora fragariaefolia]